MALLPGSAAIGKGMAVTGVNADERRFALASSIDIGAFQSGHGLVVNTAIDGADAPAGELSMREAVNIANAPDSADAGAAESITFDPTAFASPRTIKLDGSSLNLSNTTGSETITAPAAGLTISGGGTSGVFEVASGVTATLSGLVITGGTTSSSGGGLDNQGTLILTNSTVSGNTAADDGGGLYNLGRATLTACTLSGNSAGNIGGGVANVGTAALFLADCTVSGNTATVRGGGVGSLSAANLTACTVSGNSTETFDGGLYNGGTANLLDTIIAGNTGPAGASDIGGAGTV
jgi:hypothetical protein